MGTYDPKILAFLLIKDCGQGESFFSTPPSSVLLPRTTPELQDSEAGSSSKEKGTRVRGGRGQASTFCTTTASHSDVSPILKIP